MRTSASSKPRPERMWRTAGGGVVDAVEPGVLRAGSRGRRCGRRRPPRGRPRRPAPSAGWSCRRRCGRRGRPCPGRGWRSWPPRGRGCRRPPRRAHGPAAPRHAGRRAPTERTRSVRPSVGCAPCASGSSLGTCSRGRVASTGASSSWPARPPTRASRRSGCRRSSGSTPSRWSACIGREVPGIELGTAVVPTYPRHPMMLAAAGPHRQWLAGGRFTLGIGLSHQFVIEQIYELSLRASRSATCASTSRSSAADPRAVRRRSRARRSERRSASTISRRRAVPDPRRRPRAADARAGRRAGRRHHHLDDRARHAGRPHRPHDRGAAAERHGRPTPRVVAGLPVCVTDDVDGQPRARRPGPRDLRLPALVPGDARPRGPRGPGRLRAGRRRGRGARRARHATTTPASTTSSTAECPAATDAERAAHPRAAPLPRSSGRSSRRRRRGPGR